MRIWPGVVPLEVFVGLQLTVGVFCMTDHRTKGGTISIGPRVSYQNQDDSKGTRSQS